MGIEGATSEKLRAEHIEMITDKSKLSFLVKVGNLRSRMTSRRNSESAVLDALDQGDGGRTCDIAASGSVASAAVSKWVRSPLNHAPA